MIVTVTNRCENIGKSTLTLLLANYLISFKNYEKVFIVDAGKDNTLLNLYEKENSNTKIVVDSVTEHNIDILHSEKLISDMADSKNIYIVDLKADFDYKLLNILRYSKCILIPYVSFNSDIINSTKLFAESLTKVLESQNDLLFIDNFFSHENKPLSDEVDELKDSGLLINNPLRNNQNLKLSYNTVFNDMLVFKTAIEEITLHLLD